MTKSRQCSKRALTVFRTTRVNGSNISCRHQSSSPPSLTEPSSAVSSRWLSDTKDRIGKCLSFGLPPSLLPETVCVLAEIAKDWRAIVAGSEGFLTSPHRAGLHRQAVVWGEQDTMGHVNNVMYVRYAESGRCNWTRNFGKYLDMGNKQAWDEMLTSKNVGLILRSITVHFKFPMTWPDRISVYHKLRERPTDKTESLLLDVMIMSERRQRPAARCLEDVVVYDYKVGKKGVLPPFMLDQFVKTFDAQEEAKTENRARIARLLKRVRVLEKGTWDTPDAKEEFGTAGT